VLYGKGVFTTVRIIGSEPFLWSKHWRRLTASTERIGIDLSGYSEASTRKALDDLVAANAVTDGRARVTFLDDRPSEIWSGSTKGQTRQSSVTGEPRAVPGNFRLTISPYPVNSRSPLAGVKSCNYLEHILALDEAKERGFGEAIRLNERAVVTSACMSNIFWLRDGRVYTPSLSTGCLPGTTREFVLENVECEEVETDIREIESADAIFLTSAGLGVAVVGEFSERRLAESDHDILRLIPKAG
jgi:branched-subunit amino acid aminotransferase/4-amino-4-deoxychorismate lyase